MSRRKGPEVLEALRQELAVASQRVYDAWDQDDGDDYNGGGICHDIAGAICDVLGEHGIRSTAFSFSIGEVHVTAVADIDGDAWRVDIPPYVYETGGGYTWRKIPDVVFESDDVLIESMGQDFREYLEPGEDDEDERQVEENPPKVGKKIGGRTYLHHSAVRLRPDLESLVRQAQSLAGHWRWNVVRIDPRRQEVAFFQSPDFDTAPEPTVGPALVVNVATGGTRRWSQPGLIYHHKHLFVGPGYRGFDVAASARRSGRWESLGVDKSRIGRRDYWEREVTPRLNPPQVNSEGDPVAGRGLVGAFRRWFKDSKIVDVDGRPLVVYHGTNEKFDTFAAGEFGFHFGPKTAARIFGDSHRYYLRIENPLVITSDLGDWKPEDMLGLLVHELINEDDPDIDAILTDRYDAEEAVERLRHEHRADLDQDDDQFRQRRAVYLTGEPVRQMYERHGYDGIVYKNEGECLRYERDDDPRGLSFIAFRPEQVKRVDATAFDSASPRTHENPPRIDPALTAIVRGGPSVPARQIEASGLLRGRRILDFGCGQGEDAEWLRGLGYDVTCYDPGFEGHDRRPSGKFDAVMALYVANVVPGAKARKDAVRDAWSFLARDGLLFLASRSEGEVETAVARGSFSRCHDGWCSSRGTFQRGLDRPMLERLVADLPGAYVMQHQFIPGSTLIAWRV